MTFLADTSAWVEFLRATGGACDRELSAALERGDPPAWTEPVLLEVEIGETVESRAHELRRLVAAGPPAPVELTSDWRRAAELHRAARRSGRTIRSAVDCLIAAVCLRTELPVLHSDRDYDALADVSALQVVSLG